MSETSESALDFLLGDGGNGAEGGYSNRPGDRGGETNYGITFPIYAQGIVDGLIPEDTLITTLTPDQARVLYQEYFWNSPGLRLDEIEQFNPDLAIVLFDMAVNSGEGNAIDALQVTLGVSTIGGIGTETMDAIHAYGGDLVYDYIQQREVYYDELVFSENRDRSNLYYSALW